MLGHFGVYPPTSEPQFPHLYHERLGQMISKDHSSPRWPGCCDSNKEDSHPCSPTQCLLPPREVTEVLDLGHRAWVWLSSP